MHYINIANGYTLFAGYKFEKLSTGKLNILSISKSFSTRSTALSHVGRLSFIT